MEKPINFWLRKGKGGRGDQANRELNEIKDSNPQKKENERKRKERKRNTTGHTTRRAEYSSVKRRDYHCVPSMRR